MIRAVRTTAATAAIMYGPRASGASMTAERTRSLSTGLGAPLTSSKTLFSSRRKSSFGLTSEHLLHREVIPQPLCGAVDARLGGGRRNAERPGHLVERKVEVEMKHERQALIRVQLEQGAVEVCVALSRLRFGFAHVGEPDHR